jgi:hypothetical protein
MEPVEIVRPVGSYDAHRQPGYACDLHLDHGVDKKPNSRRRVHDTFHQKCHLGPFTVVNTRE